MMRVAALVVALAVLPAALASAAPGSHLAEPGLRTAVAVFLVRGEHVIPVRRFVPHTVAVAQAAVFSLLRGPTASERESGYSSQIPARTTLRGISVSRGVATVDLSRRFESGGGSLSMQLRLAQVVYTLTQFPVVSRLAFRLDGRPVESIGGEGILVSPPVGRAGFEAQTPPILVEQPLPGDIVGTPMLVRGTANVFEARLVVDLVTTNGVLLARRNVMATAGSGTRGRFNAQITLAARVARFVIVAYAHSPKNGARIDVVRIPVMIALASQRSSADGRSATAAVGYPTLPKDSFGTATSSRSDAGAFGARKQRSRISPHPRIRDRPGDEADGRV
jgi:germination protein M